MKASRRITHNGRLKNEDGSLEYFLRAVNPLGHRMGPTLFQLPPTFKKDSARLQSFLSRLPRRWPAAVEFRHQSWFDEEVYQLLRDRDIALVAVDEDEERALRWFPPPRGATCAFGGSAYDTSQLSAWAARISSSHGTKRMCFSSMKKEAPPVPLQLGRCSDRANLLKSDEDHDLVSCLALV